jgi:hypothetical protein
VSDEPRPAPLLPPPPPALQAPLRPTPPSRGWRTTIAVATVILAVVIGVNVADAAIPLPDNPAPFDAPGLPDASFPADPGAPGGPDATLTPIDRGPVEDGDQLDVGQGYSIRLPGGWTLVSQEDGVTVLQQGAALLLIDALPTEDTPEDLAQWYRDAWFQDGSYTGGDPASRTIGAGIPAADLDYTGTFDGTTVDGRIVTAAEDGAGLLVNVFAPTGSLTEVAPDLESILASVQRGGA